MKMYYSFEVQCLTYSRCNLWKSKWKFR